ncbi:MAG: hypothetical protein KAG97_10240, partial [Victivallales bacterium]|nr:hypothetical protein [Victivallales bacterium]
RVSLGIQSFDARTLAVLERRGTPAQFAAAVDMLSERGVENLGCDLIYAVPGETLTTWLNDLLRAVESGVKHVSCYSLTIEEGTRLARRIKTPTSNSDDDLDAEMWELADTVLADAEMRRYEVSNHAIPVFDCRHNMEIWHGDTYLGCGPAAASFDGERRWINPANLADWLSGAEPEIDDIHPEERAAEILAIGFRTAEGWKDAKFAERTGFALDFRKNELANLAATGLLRISDDNSVVAPTSRGLALWDEIAERLIS